MGAYCSNCLKPMDEKAKNGCKCGSGIGLGVAWVLFLMSFGLWLGFWVVGKI